SSASPSARAGSILACTLSTSPAPSSTRASSWTSRPPTPSPWACTWRRRAMGRSWTRPRCGPPSRRSQPSWKSRLAPAPPTPPYPYLTYATALLWRGLRELEAIYDRLGDAPLAAWAQETAARLHQAIQATCVVDGPFGPMFAWAVDGQGAFTLYDNPPGSLQLLGTLGLCPPDDPVLVNTIRWVHSRENPYWYPGSFGEAGSSHAPNPWPLAAANTLLAAGAPPELKGHALNLLRKAPLDGGFVCETIDPETGRARSGAAFATAAGYVAA